MSAASQYYSVTARVGVPHRHEVEVTIPLVGPAGPAGAGAGGTIAAEDLDALPETLRIVGGTDPTKKLAFEVDGITTATTRTLTVPNASGTIALNETFAAPPAIGNTTPAAGTFTQLASTAQITGANTTASPPTTTGQARGLQFALLGGTVGNTAAIYGSYAGTSTLGVGIANSSAGSITQVAAFTSTGLNLTGGTVTASAPVISATQTWNDAAVTFTGLLVNFTNTNSAAASLLASLQVGGTSVANIRRDGRVLATSFALVSGGNSGAGFSYHSATDTSGHVQFINNASAQMWTCTSARFRLSGDLSFGRAVGLGQGVDTVLVRDDAATLAQRNDANPQTSRLYGTFTSSTNYQRMTVRSVKQTLSALSGASVATTGTFIPDGAVVVGVTTRVATALTGATGYQVGDGTDADRWGDINAFALNTTSDNANWTAGTIECFTGGEVTLTANGSNFTAGAVEICVFYLAGEAD